MAESNNNVASNHGADPSTAAATPVAAAPATAAPKKAPFVSSAELRGAFLPWLQEFYRFHDPTRVPLTVVHALERRGDERDFMQELIKKFGNSPIQYPQFRNAFLQQQPLPTRTQASSPSSPPLPNPSKDRLRLRVFRFYQYYRVMDKLPMVDSIAEAYWRSEELVMMETLRTKYGPEPVMHADMVLRLPGRRQRGVALVDPKRRGVWRPKPVDAQKEAAKADSDLKAFLLQKEKSEQMNLQKQSAAAADTTHGVTTSPSSPSASPLPPAAAAVTSPAQPTSPSFVEQQAIPSSGGGHAKTVDDDLDEFLGLDDDVPPPPDQEGGGDDVAGDIASGSLWRREGGGPASTRGEDDEAETKRIRDRVRNLIINDELL